MYHIFLKDWFQIYPSNQILVINFDDYINHREDVLNRVARFLELSELKATYTSCLIILCLFLAVFVWFVILFMRFKLLSNWNCHYSAENWVGALKKNLVCFIECKSLQIYSLYIYRRFVPMLHCHKNFAAGDLTEAESKLFMADHNKKNKRNNQTLALGDMLPETRDMLRQFYRPFNVNLSRLLNSDQYLWSNWSS